MTASLRSLTFFEFDENVVVYCTDMCSENIMHQPFGDDVFEDDVLTIQFV